MPGRFELKPTLAKIWQAPDNFRIMDLLPPLHRRGIIIGALMVIVGFLLPSGGDDVDTTPSPAMPNWTFNRRRGRSLTHSRCKRSL